MAQILLLDSQEDVFVCGLCKSNYNSLQLFLEHKRKCVRTEFSVDISNPEVDKVMLDTGNVIDFQPAETASPGMEWKSNPACTLCKKTFRKMKSLAAHMKAHDEKPYQCLVCGRCFTHNSYLQRHITSHKIWPNGNTKILTIPSKAEVLNYLCQYCDTMLSNYVQYRSHLKKHQDLKRFKCIQGSCKEYFESFEEIIHHVSCTHTSPVYICHICSNSFGTLDEIANHHKVHKHVQAPSNQNKHFKCPLCDAIFKKSEKLTLHMLTENHKKVCIHCSKTFTSIKRLRLHLQVHRQLKPYQCTICASTFHMKKYLSTHMLRHTKSQFSCAVCKAMFKRQDLLQRHMKLHQIRKLYKCPFRETLDCKKEFTRSDKLKLHIKIHTKHVCISTSKTELV